LSNFKKLRITDPAKTDLAGIPDYTRRQWGAAQKRKYMGLIKGKFNALQQTPGACFAARPYQ